MIFVIYIFKIIKQKMFSIRIKRINQINTCAAKMQQITLSKKIPDCPRQHRTLPDAKWQMAKCFQRCREQCQFEAFDNC